MNKGERRRPACIRNRRPPACSGLDVRGPLYGQDARALLFVAGFLLLVLFSGFSFGEEIVRDQKWQENFRKWQQLPEERKKQLKQKFDQLQKMTPEQRKEFFENAQRFGNLPAQKKENLRKKFEFLQSLSPEQRQAILKFLRFYQKLPFHKKRMFNRRLLRLRTLSPEQQELQLQRSPIWPKLNESQRKAMRKFLLSDESRQILKGPLGRRRPFKSKRTL